VWNKYQNRTCQNHTFKNVYFCVCIYLWTSNLYSTL